MIRLLLETATDVCSVAVARDGVLLAEVTAPEVQQHASRLTLFVREALEQAGLTLSDVGEVVLSDGPGSYTSLRVGAATAKGLCLALPDLRLAVVPTLQSLATAAPAGPADRILATINSRRDEVYGQLFAMDTRTPETEVLNIRLKDPQWRGKLRAGAGLGRVWVCGPGQDRIQTALEHDNALSYGEPGTAAARHLIAPAPRRPDVAAYEPFYLNPPFVTRSKKKPLL
ncbi:tRNA (adenosine(37)-N6)-threonylcarbamoyltransferase complex dimerization subunit type 1 TsaB [Lewinella sp. IMCC34183]|uniref:tRNA (adenosine(37)-N6)-threonylcarbamoyltransferase complex dimerization subunit type 1 TsaB n=1 Tax=Lewinella sp. IMCC34183 TaxID=2248762 RepID=UPI000E288ECC|nr:tRNA (adenosine(37)-N6)-threonylcarbamoyltransferase complex dimerization subunit type 1 TsaB [Lewinella sp. IMCC34183]